ncbi:MAG: methyl-accepting chemotaxis protein [Nitrospiria bacterium]
MKRVSDRIRKIVEGDISGRAGVMEENELGRLEIGSRRPGEELSELVAKIAQTGRKISSIVSVIEDETRDMTVGAEIQTKAANVSRDSLGQITSRIKDVVEFSESLTETSSKSLDALEQMTEAIIESTRNTTILGHSVEGATKSISVMSSSIKGIDEYVGTLLKEIELSSSSMTKMDLSLRKMRENIMETVSLSQEARDNAEAGKMTVASTREGMARIKANADKVTGVIQNLQQKTERIGKFLNVIDDVAEQTNLLALNAAIIASKAGRHGKGFSIISNEIKELSDRTASSTHEIHAIINDLKSEGEMAVETIEIGNKRIEEGVEFSSSAYKALSRIMESVERSAKRTDFVAKVVREQSGGVKQAMRSMERVTGMMSHIARTTQGQNTESGVMIDATDQIRKVATELESAMKTEAKWMEKVKGMVNDVSGQALKIASAASDQNRQSGDMNRAVSEIKKVAHATEDAIKKVSSAVEELTKQTEALEGNISRFKVLQ